MTRRDIQMFEILRKLANTNVIERSKRGEEITLRTLQEAIDAAAGYCTKNEIPVLSVDFDITGDVLTVLAVAYGLG